MTTSTTDAESIRETFARVVVEADRDWNGNVAGYRKYLVDRLTDCGLFVLASRREAQEPVAWRYRWKIDGEWVSWRVSERSQASEHLLPSLEEYPLYLAPPAPAGEVERLRAVLKDAQAAIEQAIDCIRGESPEDMDHANAERDTLTKLRDADHAIATALNGGREDD